MKTILIVDDMPVFREPLDLILRNEGYRTRTAANGSEALAAASESSPDLILLDLNMPVMDGIEFLERLRASPRMVRTPVIIFSEVADKARIMQAVKLGVAGYLLKAQFSMKHMLERIRETLRESERAAAASQSNPAASSRTAAKPRLGTDALALKTEDPDPAARLRQLRPIVTRGDVLEKVQACDQLRALGPTVAHVLKLTNNAHCSIEALSRAIAQDHAIALKILKLANSSVYTRGEPVDSVQKAVVRIGMERIRQAVLNISVIESFGGAAGKFIDTCQFWEHAIATGLIAAELAHGVDPKRADSAFTMGLLHDVGRVLFAEQLGETYEQVVETARRLDLPLEQVETRMLVTNHADVMEQMLHAWKFAKDLVAPIVHHHLSAENIRAQAPALLGETARLALANRLAHALLMGSSGNDTVYPFEDLCQVLKLDSRVIEHICATVPQQTDDIKFAMLSSGNNAVWTERRAAMRSQFKQPFCPLFVSARPDVDAFGIFCRQLASDDGGEGPSVLVVHIASIRDRAAASKLVRCEEALQDLRLPAIVLSPGGKLNLEDELVQGRRVISLPTPLAPHRFIEAVNLLVDENLAAAA